MLSLDRDGIWVYVYLDVFGREDKNFYYGGAYYVDSSNTIHLVRENGYEETATLKYDNEGKAIRLDVFVKDKNRLIDVEIQLKDTKELPERARYYQGLMDLDSLGKGESYKKLKDSHVIFICMENIFSAQKKDLPVYTFENMCREDNSVKLNDRTYKHFFIAPTCAKMIEDEEIRSFFEFLITNNPADNYTSELDSYVTYAKKNMQWRMEFMTWERMETYKYEEGFEDGDQNGRQNKAIETATNFLKEKISPEIIARCVGLPLEEVLKLEVELKK